MTLGGKVAIVTAAGSGIGRASAMTMAARGASVLVTDIRPDGAVAVAAEIVAAGGKATAMAVDVEQPEQLREMVAKGIATYGRLDILHNNAALLDAKFSANDVGLMTLNVKSWDRFMAVNLRSVMLACQAAVPEMLKAGGGSIINTSSTLGLLADMQFPAYGTSKAAIIGLTRYIATEFGKRGIRCNAVAPALILTPMVLNTMPPKLIKAHEEAALTPFVGQAQDVANAVAFLASDDARFITGHVLPVDGGTTAHLPSVQDFWRYLELANAKSFLDIPVPL
jgi:NAD(P)-dependent dehydrogenase (short-subunit alcohol dehydrogenase family)